MRCRAPLKKLQGPPGFSILRWGIDISPDSTSVALLDHRHSKPRSPMCTHHFVILLPRASRKSFNDSKPTTPGPYYAVNKRLMEMTRLLIHNKAGVLSKRTSAWLSIRRPVISISPLLTVTTKLTSSPRIGHERCLRRFRVLV